MPLAMATPCAIFVFYLNTHYDFLTEVTPNRTGNINTKWPRDLLFSLDDACAGCGVVCVAVDSHSTHLVSQTDSPGEDRNVSLGVGVGVCVICIIGGVGVCVICIIGGVGVCVICIIGGVGVCVICIIGGVGVCVICIIGGVGVCVICIIGGVGVCVICIIGGVVCVCDLYHWRCWCCV